MRTRIADLIPHTTYPDGWAAYVHLLNTKVVDWPDATEMMSILSAAGVDLDGFESHLDVMRDYQIARISADTLQDSRRALDRIEKDIARLSALLDQYREQVKEGEAAAAEIERIKRENPRLFPETAT